MCRLFGFRSVECSPVHHALVTERNSLRVQSIEHRDGWGIASYDAARSPQIARGLGPALTDPEFERVSGLLSSHAVVAHIRLASVGPVELRNVHPFVRGRWTFAHNGTVRDFARHQPAIEERILPELRASFTGDTDSERCFFLFLTHLRELGERPGAEAAAVAMARTVRELAALSDEGPARSSMNFLATDGDVLVAIRREKTLFFAAHGAHRSPRPTAPRPGEKLEQLVVASEQLSIREPWHTVGPEELIGVDADLTFHRWQLSELIQAP